MVKERKRWRKQPRENEKDCKTERGRHFRRNIRKIKIKRIMEKVKSKNARRERDREKVRRERESAVERDTDGKT